jgi:uncharacterized protein (TIGR02246 family)
MDDGKSKEVTQMFLERINAGDADGLAALMTDDHTFVNAVGAELAGRDVARDAYAEYFRERPDFKILVDAMAVSGDGVAIVGTTQGSCDDPAAERRSTCVWTTRVRDGLVAEFRLYQ